MDIVAIQDRVRRAGQLYCDKFRGFKCSFASSLVTAQTQKNMDVRINFVKIADYKVETPIYSEEGGYRPIGSREETVENRIPYTTTIVLPIEGEGWEEIIEASAAYATETVQLTELNKKRAGIAAELAAMDTVIKMASDKEKSLNDELQKLRDKYL